MSDLKTSVFTTVLAVALTPMSISSLAAAASLTGGADECPSTCTAGDAQSPGPPEWYISWDNLENGTGTEYCEPCLSCEGELYYEYTGSGAPLLNILVWDDSEDKYVPRSQRDLTGHESAYLVIKTPCDGIPLLYEFTASEGSVQTSLFCPCQV